MAISRYTNSKSAITPTMTVSIYPPYSFSQSSVYRAPTIKNATTVPTKIKSPTRSLLHLFTEPKVQPVHTQNQNNTDDDEFAHKTDLTHERTLAAVLVKLLAKRVKKTLTPAKMKLCATGRRIRSTAAQILEAGLEARTSRYNR